MQANLRAADSDVEMKRMRESEDDSEVRLLLQFLPGWCESMSRCCVTSGAVSAIIPCTTSVHWLMSS